MSEQTKPEPNPERERRVRVLMLDLAMREDERMQAALVRADAERRERAADIELTKLRSLVEAVLNGRAEPPA